jgi:PAS domain S-box-containing protein
MSISNEGNPGHHSRIHIFVKPHEQTLRVTASNRGKTLMSRQVISVKRKSANDHAAILDSLPEGVLGLNHAGQVTYANAQSCILLGHSRKELTSMNFAKMGLRLKAAGASGKPLSFKSFIKSHLGKKQPVSLVMIRGKQTDDLMARVQRVGDVDATSFIMTIRKPSEFSYRAVGAIIGSIGYAIIGTDEQQIIRRFSAAAELCFGYKNDEIIGKPFATLLPQDQHAAFKKYFQTIAKHNTIKPDIGIEGNVRARHKDGTEFSIMAHMASYGSGKQKIFTVVLRDIAFRIARTAEINRLAEQRRLAFENIVEGIVCFDKDNRLSAFNKQFLIISSS